jgi:hypothetical protein
MSAMCHKGTSLARLFDHLVGAREQCSRQVEAERRGGLQIDDQLVFGRRLHRQVGGLLTLEDAINVTGRASVVIATSAALSSAMRAPRPYYLPEFEAAARSLKVTPISAPVHNVAELETVITALGREPVGGFVGMGDFFLYIHRAAMISLAARNKIRVDRFCLRGWHAVREPVPSDGHQQCNLSRVMGRSRTRLPVA